MQQPMQGTNPPQISGPMNNTMPNNVTQQDPLAQLRDIHVPDDVSAWPLDWGWWCLIVFIIAALFFTTRAVYRHIQHNKARKCALQELKTVSMNNENWPQSLNTLLKRVALSYYPQNEVASLHGEAWFTFLKNQCSSNDRANNGFDSLEQNLYRQETNNSAFDDCFYATEHWISKTAFPKNNKHHLIQMKGALLREPQSSDTTSIVNRQGNSEVNNA